MPSSRRDAALELSSKQLLLLVINPADRAKLARSWPTYRCSHCHRAPASGVWAVVNNLGKVALRAACGRCGLGLFPVRYFRVRLLVTIEPEATLD